MDNNNKTERVSESPARTIDSRDSTSASLETIVNRNKLQEQTAAMENSTNSNNKNSLTNSQISMISNDQKDSHIYTSPDLIGTKTEKLLAYQEQQLPPSPQNQKKQQQQLLHQHQQQQQQQQQKQQSIKSDAPTKKASLITDQKSSVKSSIEKKKSFPIHIVLGIIQLVLSVALAGLGGLLIARGASLAVSGCGLWAGAISAIAGSLGVINLKKVQTGFLAVSLICVASSTLALAISGIGLVRDVNKLDQQDTNIQNTKSAISAGSGLIFVLILHFIASIVSVYKSALKLCSRHSSSSQMLENVITVNNASVISQQKVEEYIKSMTSQQYHQCREKMLSPENCDKLMAMWMHQAKRGVPPPINHIAGHGHQAARQVMLVPASTGSRIPTILPSPPPPPGYRHTIRMVPHPSITGCIPYPGGMLLPHIPPGSTIHSDIIHKLYTSQRPTSEISKRQQQQHQRRRTGKNDANKRQRRKSESDAENAKAFTYTGLDRAIADSFLERQEISHGGSNMDYSSSNESSRDGCPDIVM